MKAGAGVRWTPRGVPEAAVHSPQACRWPPCTPQGVPEATALPPCVTRNSEVSSLTHRAAILRHTQGNSATLYLRS